MKKKEKEGLAFNKENIKLMHSKHWYIHSAVQTF